MIMAKPFTKPNITGCGTKRINLPIRKSPAPICMAPIKISMPTKPGRPKRGRPAPAPTKVMINAIRVQGYWRKGSDGHESVYKLLERLRQGSEFFNVPANEKAVVTLPDQIEEDNFASPFVLILPLKNPIPAPIK